MPTSPADLRALAARCCTGEESRELRDAILTVLGWTYDRDLRAWLDQVGSVYAGDLPNPLTDLNASVALMPAGWRIWRIEQGDDLYRAEFARAENSPRVIGTSAPTERHARTAAALMARAAELEQS